MNAVRGMRILLLVALAATAWGARAGSSPREEVEAMLARLLRAPESRARVFITRSDPFGGPGERTAGRLWFLPGRGLRFHSEERGGEDIVVDHEKGAFLVYRPTEGVLYRAEWDRAPARMRQLVLTPEKLLDADYVAVRERRRQGGVWRAGYRLQRASPADSLPNVSVWLAADPATGLPRWVNAGGDEDSLEVEFRSITLLPKAEPHDLVLSLPRGVTTQPLDPRDLLPGGESR
ncbi:MAG TPA: hypothetical protein VEU09_10805 [Candidatus Binatia bacterium]|nr:hypothetical protein [Candidatus Binatia bacterium]